MSIRKLALALLFAGGVSVAVLAHRYSHEIVVHAASEPVTIRQMGGDIDVPDAPDGTTLETMGGNIRLGSAGSFAKLKTMGGNIAVDRANASVDASTMGGKITLHNVNGSIHAATMAGDVTAHIVGASNSSRDIQLSSKAGTITLTVPKDFGMDVQVTLAYTQEAGPHFRIIDHMGLSQKETQEWDNSHGSPRKYIRATGRVGNGQNHVTIETINGDVILKQE